MAAEEVKKVVSEKLSKETTAKATANEEIKENDLRGKDDSLMGELENSLFELAA